MGKHFGENAFEGKGKLLGKNYREVAFTEKAELLGKNFREDAAPVAGKEIKKRTAREKFLNGKSRNARERRSRYARARRSRGARTKTMVSKHQEDSISRQIKTGSHFYVQYLFTLCGLKDTKQLSIF